MVVVEVAFVVIVDGHEVELDDEQGEDCGVGNGPLLADGEESCQHDEAKQDHVEGWLGGAEVVHAEEEPVAAALEEWPADVAVVDEFDGGVGVELPAVEGDEEAQQNDAVHDLEDGVGFDFGQVEDVGVGGGELFFEFMHVKRLASLGGLGNGGKLI